jgi:hypothetical protein
MKCSKCYGNILPNSEFCTNCGELVSVNKSLPKKSFIKNLFTFSHNELNDKWWHRLTKIVTYASTITVFLFSFFFLYENIDRQINPEPKYIYSFDKNYSKTFGIVRNCNFSPKNTASYTSINCGYVEEGPDTYPYHTLRTFLDQWTKARSYDQSMFWVAVPKKTAPVKSTSTPTYNIFTGKFEDTGGIFDNYDSTTGGVFDDLVLPSQRLELSHKLLNEKIQQGLFDDVTVKKVILIYPLLRNIALVFIAPILWFLFIKLVVYKSIIYIIYGSK